MPFGSGNRQPLRAAGLSTSNIKPDIRQQLAPSSNLTNPLASHEQSTLLSTGMSSRAELHRTPYEEGVPMDSSNLAYRLMMHSPTSSSVARQSSMQRSSEHPDEVARSRDPSRDPASTSH